jgi:hypothetical protein
MTPEERAQRTEQLRAKLEASLHLGKPMMGYKERAAAIQAELDRLEAEGG